MRGLEVSIQKEQFFYDRGPRNSQISAGICMFCFLIIKKFSGANVSEAHTAVHTELERNLQR